MISRSGALGVEEPLPQFNVKGAKAGDKVSVTWKDNRGEATRTDVLTRPVPADDPGP